MINTAKFNRAKKALPIGLYATIGYNGEFITLRDKNSQFSLIGHYRTIEIMMQEALSYVTD